MSAAATTGPGGPPAGAPEPAVLITTSVVICAFTRRRWPDLQAAVDSVRRQSRVPEEIVVVIDHNDALDAMAREQLTGVRVVQAEGPQGLSGARNTGIARTTGDVVAFLDDDATADPDWIARTIERFADPCVIGVGGWAVARWDAPGRPAWFPEPFLWTVGCSYQGLPTSTAPVRNPIGAVMAFHRRAFTMAGEFTAVLGRVGTRPVGCEETEFSIRVRQADPEAVILLEPTARVHHRVSPQRRRLRYFLRRCYHEGRSKAAVAGLVGSTDGLSSERDYVRKVLPAAAWSGLLATARTGRPAGALSALAILAGSATTAWGYLCGRVGSARPGRAA